MVLIDEATVFTFRLKNPPSSVISLSADASVLTMVAYLHIGSEAVIVNG
ncbi:hypothetical protein [Amphibacillus cookii]|nr:hypothetical protein [Amphibacillus cookii]MBM7543133.1 hypothetical protein [Amphibacillus cookii]